MGDPYIGDLTELVVDGNPITSGSSLTSAANQKTITAPACWARGEVTIPGSTAYSITVNCTDEDDHADFLTLLAISRAKLPVAVLAYPRGNVAGRLVYSGNAYVSEPSLDLSLDKASTYSFTLNFTDDMTITPNLALSATDFGSVAAGAAASGYTDPTASGGTSTYTITMEDENGVASALPEGVSWSGSAFTGTVDAGANVGIYRIKVKVVDSTATPITKYFLCTMGVTA